ncbi:MAG TPA: redox-sensing transcriptional repressor Rex [Anaerolineales bacterium]|nr:redox-sensing transcriptional repressor Rex [Anaerolineales bacterium]
MNAPNVPDIVISRLPVYLRALQYLEQQGIKTTSSVGLGEKVGISAAQIRKDLSQFGEFGKQGTGYDVNELIEQLQQILHVQKVRDVVLVGMGELGHAILRYGGFIDRGFRICHCYDNDPAKIGMTIGEYEILDVADLGRTIRECDVKMAMLCTPAVAAQKITDIMVESGIKAILNYAPVSLNVPKDVRVQYIDPVIGLQRMAYYLNKK